MSNDLVKQNINFLEHPLWTLSENPAKVIKLVNERGAYLLRSGYKIPERIDMIFLLYFLLISQKNGYIKKLEFTRYEILKACGIKTGQREYDRLEESLERWKHLGLKFKGTFYDNEDYLMRSFGIINEYEMSKKTKKLKIELNKSFLLMIKTTKFCKYIDFEDYKKLKRPMSNRLYEILSKSFNTSDEWQIEALKLAQKLTLAKKFPSQIIEKVLPAVNEINKNTELRISFDSHKNNTGETILIFKLDKNLKLARHQKDERHIKTLIDFLREGYKQSTNLKATLQKYYSKNGFDYVKYNILYANQKASRAYIGFLKKSLKENWGDEFKKEEEKKKQEYQQGVIKKTATEKEEKQKAEKDYNEANNMLTYCKSLDDTEFNKLIDRVVKISPEEKKKLVFDPIVGFKKLSICTISTFMPELKKVIG